MNEILKITFKDMGLFSRMISNYRDKKAIRTAVLWLSKGLIQVDQELKKTNQEVTLPIRDIGLIMQIHVKWINQTIKPNGVINRDLIDPLMVKLSTGEKVLFVNFCNTFNRNIMYLKCTTDLDLIIYTWR